jgi:hypothetical protein
VEESGVPQSGTVYFDLELHWFFGTPPFLSLKARREGQPYFSSLDVSMAFHAGSEDVDGIAFQINFCLPSDFTLGEFVFDELEKLGLPRWIMAQLCDLAAREGTVDAEIVARVLYAGPSHEEGCEEQQIH